MRFNDLLEASGLVCEEVLLVRHRPSEAVLARTLRNDLANDVAPLFDAYQRSQNPRFGSWLKNVTHLAAFFEDGRGRALFAGLYAVHGFAAVDEDAWRADPLNLRLIESGMKPWASADRREVIRLDLEQTNALAELRGRLLVEWVTRGQNWTHRADRHELPVLALHEHSAFDPPPPDWRDWVLSWSELSNLPTRQRHSLAEWRGIYLIIDLHDGSRYVGSASGAENIYGRWRAYGESGDGGNVLLRGRAPGGFRFSILQRLSPDTPRAEVIALEASWKRRLHTQPPFGLNAN